MGSLTVPRITSNTVRQWTEMDGMRGGSTGTHWEDFSRTCVMEEKWSD